MQRPVRINEYNFSTVQDFSFRYIDEIDSDIFSCFTMFDTWHLFLLAIITILSPIVMTIIFVMRRKLVNRIEQAVSVFGQSSWRRDTENWKKGELR